MVVVTMILLYYHYDPSQTFWSPKCILLAITGYKCPGCGIQRMIYHLLHGHILTALRYNYFIALLIPYITIMSSTYFAPSSNYTQWIRRHLATKQIAYAYGILYVLWWFVRNIFNL